MSETLATWRIRKRGFWRPVHEVRDESGTLLGCLRVERNGWGLIVRGEYVPEKGERLIMRRDPGLLRAQFSLWTEGGEWLGSSLRWSLFRRQIDLWTGSRPYRLVPVQGFRRGWRIVAARTGASAILCTRPGLLGLLWPRSLTTIEQVRKIDFELLLFAQFLGSLTTLESFWPTALDAEQGQDSAPAPQA